MLCVDLAILKFSSHMHRTDIGPPANPSSKLQAAFALRAIELSVRHFRFHFHFRFPPPLPRQPAPACVLFAAYCIWRPFHIVLLPCLLPVAAIVSRVQLCPVWSVRGIGRAGRREGGQEGICSDAKHKWKRIGFTLCNLACRKSHAACWHCYAA